MIFGTRRDAAAHRAENAAAGAALAAASSAESAEYSEPHADGSHAGGAEGIAGGAGSSAGDEPDWEGADGDEGDLSPLTGHLLRQKERFKTHRNTPLDVSATCASAPSNRALPYHALCPFVGAVSLRARCSLRLPNLCA